MTWQVSEAGRWVGRLRRRGRRAIADTWWQLELAAELTWHASVGAGSVYLLPDRSVLIVSPRGAWPWELDRTPRALAGLLAYPAPGVREIGLRAISTLPPP